MEKHHRINWKKGLLVTPEIFIESDNYHIAERNLLGRFLASQQYGILPNNNFLIDSELHNNHLIIKNLKCVSITQNGHIINIPDNLFTKKELSLETSVGDELYVVASIVPDSTQMDENELHIIPEYAISIKKPDEVLEKEIPVLKIIKKELNREIDHHYIPPSIALNSVVSLMNKFIEIKNVINKIIDRYIKQNLNEVQIKLLQLELNNCSGKASPETLALMVKKFCFLFQIYLKSVNKVDTLCDMEKFMDTPFNPNEIEKSLHLGYKVLMEMLHILETVPKVEEIEEINV